VTWLLLRAVVARTPRCQSSYRRDGVFFAGHTGRLRLPLWGTLLSDLLLEPAGLFISDSEVGHLKPTPACLALGQQPEVSACFSLKP
jgi:hypothetical protein